MRAICILLVHMHSIHLILFHNFVVPKFNSLHYLLQCIDVYIQTYSAALYKCIWKLFDVDMCTFNFQVTTLVSQKGSRKKKGRSKKAHVLAAAVEKATESFIIQGETIAHENPEIRNEMLLAVDDVKKTGISQITFLMMDFYILCRCTCW